MNGQTASEPLPGADSTDTGVSTTAVEIATKSNGVTHLVENACGVATSASEAAPYKLVPFAYAFSDRCERFFLRSFEFQTPTAKA
jgi:hypothetical protein